MEYGAIDLHTRHSEIRVVDAAGRVILEQRVPTSRERLVAAFRAHPHCRILLESSTESAWVAEALEAAGHPVIVADPNFAPMYGDRRRRVKTDRRDVAALAEANRCGWYRAAYRVSPAQRDVRQMLRGRRQLVQMRTGMISLMRSLLRQVGLRVGRAASERIAARIETLPVPEPLATTLVPLRRVVTQLTEAIDELEAALTTRAQADPVVTRLRTVPGVGPIVALTFRAYVDQVERFTAAAQVSAAVGLVPREDSSGERRQLGHITKVGPRELRSLLIQAAWGCWRSRAPASLALRAWVDQLAERRGKRIAVVALARRLSRILFAVWRDETTFRAAEVAA